MTQSDDLGPLVGRWLRDEARPMPPEVLAAIREAVPRTRQLGRHGLGGSDRRGSWTTPLALIAGVAVLAVILGPATLIRFQSWLQPAGGAGQEPARPSPDPVATPSPFVTAEPTLTPAPTASRSPAASPPAAAPSASTTTGSNPDPWTGTWSTNDVDGSTTILTFTGKGSTRNALVDDVRATACGGAHHVSSGNGTIRGSTIRVVGSGGCAGQPATLRLDSTWTYDAANGTLTSPAADLGTFTWTRGPARTDAFSRSWTAISVDGRSMTLALTGSGMTRVVSLSADGASACGPGIGLTAHGTGTIGAVPGDGKFIRVSLHGTCADGTAPTDTVEKYEYDFLDDTLIGPLAPLGVGGSPLPQTVTWHQG